MSPIRWSASRVAEERTQRRIPDAWTNDDGDASVPFLGGHDYQGGHGNGSGFWATQSST